MKLNNLIALFAALLLITSCGDDSSDSVVGTYTLVDFELLDGCDDPEFQSVNVQNGCLLIGNESSCLTFILFENGTAQGIISFGNETEITDLTYSYNEDTNVITLCDGSDCNNLTRDGDRLRIVLMEDECEIVYIFEK